MRERDILAQVDGEQQAAVVSPAGPLLVVAGPGSGKTRTVVCRIAYRVLAGGQQPATVLAVTHSTRAAGELRDRLVRTGVSDIDQVQACTLHAAALRQLRYFWDRYAPNRALHVCENRFEIAAGALRAVTGSRAETTEITDVLSEIEWAKGQMVGPDGYLAAALRARRATSVGPDIVVAAFRAYAERLRARDLLDFTDLLTVAAEMIGSDEDIAAEVRARYRALYVDEYQDTDLAQQALIDAWLGDRADITAVGDPRQSIYGFKGASATLLADFPTRYPGANVVTLIRDYRSAEPVVAVANSLAAASDNADSARPTSGSGRAVWDAAHPAPLVSTTGAGPAVTFMAQVDDDAEATWIAERIAKAVAGGARPRDVAILYRFNSQSAPFEQALAAAGVPYRVEGGVRFFERPEIGDVMRTYQERLRKLVGDAVGEADDLVEISGPDLLREVLADSGWRRDAPPGGAGAARDRWEHLAALLRLVEENPQLSQTGPYQLLTELASRRAAASDAVVDAVTLATIHKAKGLEWDTVFCPGWVEGQLPAFHARTGAEIAEERRLAYVAVSRARRNLLVTYPLKRGRMTRQPSRFIAEAGGGAPAAGAEKAARATCRKCRRPLRLKALADARVCESHLPGPAAVRMAKLRQWRTSAAEAAGVPPYRVFSDDTLAHLSLTPPANEAAMATISGVGPAKLAKFGKVVIDLLR